MKPWGPDALFSGRSREGGAGEGEGAGSVWSCYCLGPQARRPAPVNRADGCRQTGPGAAFAATWSKTFAREDGLYQKSSPSHGTERFE